MDWLDHNWVFAIVYHRLKSSGKLLYFRVFFIFLDFVFANLIFSDLARFRSIRLCFEHTYTTQTQISLSIHKRFIQLVAELAIITENKVKDAINFK